MKHHARTDTQLQNILGEVRQAYKANGFVEVDIRTGKRRSDDQNRLSHEWYEQVARELREHDALDVKCECKLLYGVPMLRAEDEDFREMYDGMVKERFSYEEKLQLMKWIPVTSLMNTDQLSRYLEAVQSAYAKRGVILEFPQ